MGSNGAIAVGLLLALLTGCSSGPDIPEIETRALDLTITPDANQDNAIAVDLVLVFDIALVDQVGGIDAATWFMTRDQILLANPTGFEVQSFELIPGQPRVPVEVGDRGEDAVGAFLFASYMSPGPHRARIDTLRDVVVELGRETFTVSPPPT